MRVERFDYPLPAGLVAQEPAARRDASRLMVLDRSTGQTLDDRFDRIGEHLAPGDLLVLNDTRVVPARLIAMKPTGGRVELLVLGREEAGAWRCLLSASRGVRHGTVLRVAPGFEAEVVAEIADGRYRVALRTGPEGAEGALRRHGRMPLPPYIRRGRGDPRDALDRERYQTVYARREGAVAAPTAGLHFTLDLLRTLRERGVAAAGVTLHVGPGTFQPVRAGRIEDHRVEPEWAELPADTAAAIARCRGAGGRVVAVGTTVTRVLEWRADGAGGVAPGEGMCDLYILPGHEFRVVDALITNFHLPRSSLLILVAAFAGRERILRAYGRAVELGYRFYSYGDAMLIR
ncbi:MAG: tRNA preQ1(34) S-adenosylmethionine ribosyltransferase-isomerase QueA [Acidobacteriota bacterium]